MISKELIIELYKCRMMYLQGLITWRQTRILSGFYKTRIVTRNDVQLTDDELLADEMNILEGYTTRMLQIEDQLFDLEKKDD